MAKWPKVSPRHGKRLIQKREATLKKKKIQDKFLFFVLILMLLSGCSYNMGYTHASPARGVGCAKFISEWTQYERDMCSH